MNEPSRRGRTKEFFWRKALARLSESGLTQVEFCKREALNASNLSWWKRELAARDAAGRKTGKTFHLDPEVEEKAVHWRNIVSRFGSSGLCKDDFCAQEGIKPQAFCWWRAELERRDSGKTKPVARSPATVLDMFLPLTPTEQNTAKPVAKTPHPIAEMDLVQGTLRILNSASTEELVELLMALRELGK